MSDKVKKRNESIKLDKSFTDYVIVKRSDLIKLRSSISDIRSTVFLNYLDKSVGIDNSIMGKFTYNYLSLINDRITLYLDQDRYNIEFPFPVDQELPL